MSDDSGRIKAVGIIMCTIDDAISDLLYYDRKEDEDLPVGAIQELVAKGEITVDEMVRLCLK